MTIMVNYTHFLRKVNGTCLAVQGFVKINETLLVIAFYAWSVRCYISYTFRENNNSVASSSLLQDISQEFFTYSILQFLDKSWQYIGGRYIINDHDMNTEEWMFVKC